MTVQPRGSTSNRNFTAGTRGRTASNQNIVSLIPPEAVLTRSPGWTCVSVTGLPTCGLKPLSSRTKLVVSKENWSFTYYYKDKKLTSGGWRSTGVIFENAYKQQARLQTQLDDTFWSYPADPTRTYIREQLYTTKGVATTRNPFSRTRASSRR